MKRTYLIPVRERGRSMPPQSLGAAARFSTTNVLQGVRSLSLSFHPRFLDASLLSFANFEAGSACGRPILPCNSTSPGWILAKEREVAGS